MTTEIERRLEAAGVRVSRYSILDPITGTPSGDFLRVGNTDLGAFRDIVDAEYARCVVAHPKNPAFFMRPMFYTGSPFGAEIMDLVSEHRASVLAQLGVVE